MRLGHRLKSTDLRTGGHGTQTDPLLSLGMKLIKRKHFKTPRGSRIKGRLGAISR
jgi:hypothetical protein